MDQGAHLIKPSIAYQDAYMSFYQDWISSEEDMVPWVIERDPSDFNAYIDFLYSQDSAEKVCQINWVPHSTFWLLAETGQIVGAVNIRHKLNEKLYNSGGHIGYGICPGERRKGYAAVLLELSLQKARELGIDRALLVCDKGNRGSERTILKNGGVFESEFIESNGNIVRRFWIDLKNQ
jgi:predicted acetyltransferase